MNARRSGIRPFLKVVVTFGAFFIAGGLSAVTWAQKVSSTAAPAGSVGNPDGTGGAGYIVPDTVYVPSSSIERGGDAGRFAHTDYVLFSPNGGPPEPMTSPSNTYAETPASLGCVYKVGPIYTGCSPATGGTNHPTGGWGAIALVDAYDNPNAATDISTFDTHFGLPAANFTKVYANGNRDCSTPPPNGGWALEESLDIEWAHVFAPSAKIYLVEACSNSNADLFYAERVAAGLVAGAGGGDISNSWGQSEFSGETAYDPYFYYNQYPKVSDITFFASAGDSGCGAAYPSSSPWLVSAGGTTVNRNSSEYFSSETCWSGSGGGSSTQEKWSNSFTGGNTGAWADYQYPIFGMSSRQTPDLAFDADPNSGVYVYSGYNGGWYIVGGTSVASPSLAGIVNSAANKLGSYFLPAANPRGYFNAEENNLLYSQLPALANYATNFYDVTSGSNGCFVGQSWDYCTGVGSPRGKGGK
jgi:subtilase family serine protease